MGRKLSLPKVFPIRLVGVFFHHDGGRNNHLSEGCLRTVYTQKFPLFFGCYGDIPITFVLTAAEVISAWYCPTAVTSDSNE